MRTLATSNKKAHKLAQNSVASTCISFYHGCVGCCMNMRWSDEKIVKWVKDNTEYAESHPSRNGSRPTFRELAVWHWHRGGFPDFILAFVLAIPTCGISVWLWRRFRGSCPFAGYVDEDRRKAGCLIHPERLGLPDLRVYAFPLLPLVWCNTTLECPAWNAGIPMNLSLPETSRQAYRARRKGVRWWQELKLTLDTFLNNYRHCAGQLLRRFRRSENASAIIEYAIIGAVITVGIALVLAPRPTGHVGTMYDLVRDAYRRAVVVVSVPLL